MNRVSRRTFLGGAAGSLALSAAWPSRAQSAAARVAAVTHGNAWRGDGWGDQDLDADEVRVAVERALAALTGTGTTSAALDALFPALADPEQRYAIKVNCVNELLPSHPTVVRALTDLLVGAGARAENIVVFDRTDHELADSGFVVNRGTGVRVYGTGDDYGTDQHALSHGNVRLTGIVEVADHLINVPVLKNHEMAGVTLALKNHFGSIDRPELLHGADRSCCPGIAELNAVAAIRDKTRLVLIDAMFGTVRAGLAARPDVAPMTVIASTDPVAADAVGQALINRERDDPIDARHIHEAADAGLGVADLAAIDPIALELSPAVAKPKPWQTDDGCACSDAPGAVLTTTAAALLARTIRR